MSNTQEPPSTHTFSGDTNPCKVEGCGTTDKDKPMAFRGEDYCSESHRKILNGEKVFPTQTEDPPRKQRETRNF